MPYSIEAKGEIIYTTSDDADETVSLDSTLIQQVGSPVVNSLPAFKEDTTTYLYYFSAKNEDGEFKWTVDVSVSLDGITVYDDQQIDYPNNIEVVDDSIDFYLNEVNEQEFIDSGGQL